MQRKAVFSVGGVADKVASKLELSRIPSFARAGALLRHILGTETLRSTSITIAIGFAFAPAILTWIGNVGGRLHFWSGSEKYWTENGGKSTDIHIDPDVALSTAIGGVGRSGVAKGYGSIRFPWFGAKVGKQRYHGIGIGLRHVLGVSAGETEGRGPYVSGGIGVPFGFFRVSVGAGLFYPPFELIARYTRPLAEKIRSMESSVVRLSRRVSQAVNVDNLMYGQIALERLFF